MYISEIVLDNYVRKNILLGLLWMKKFRIAPANPFNFFFESHVAPANTWHCPIPWEIKGSYKPQYLGPIVLRNATISFHCTSAQ